MPSSPAFYTLSLHDALPISAIADAHLGGIPRNLRKFQHCRETVFVARLLVHDDGLELGALVAKGLGHAAPLQVTLDRARLRQDRKSTRLNSSHANISYAVFPRLLHSFPTRRSSDLSDCGCAPWRNSSEPAQVSALPRNGLRRSSSGP